MKIDKEKETKEQEEIDKFLVDMENDNKEKAKTDFKNVIETKKEKEEISEFLPSIVE